MVRRFSFSIHKRPHVQSSETESIQTSLEVYISSLGSMDQLIKTLGHADPGECVNNATERMRVAEALYAAWRRFQQPWDIAFEQNYEHSLTHSAVKAAIDAGVFHKWAEAGGGTKSSKELAQLTETDPVLIKRLVRHLAAQHLLTEVGEDAYQPTPWSTTLASDPAFASWYGSGFYYDLCVPAYQNLPAFLAATAHRENPTDAQAGNFQHLRGAGTSYFDYMSARPLAAKEFNDAMEVHSKYMLRPWVYIYPTHTVVNEARERPGRPMVVDVGGGKGHDLEKFRLRHHRDSDMPAGALVLQERPDVVEKLLAERGPRLLLAPAGPGARVYLLHNILHDWADEDAVRILANIADAMEKGYLRLLIHESIVSTVRPHRRVTTTDLTMMALFSAKERTEEEFGELVVRAGLR
ncbi:hypothetical protein PG984_016547, partial [Apiospora sp. TS-2023a]